MPPFGPATGPLVRPDSYIGDTILALPFPPFFAMWCSFLPSVVGWGAPRGAPPPHLSLPFRLPPLLAPLSDHLHGRHLAFPAFRWAADTLATHPGGAPSPCGGAHQRWPAAGPARMFPAPPQTKTPILARRREPALLAAIARLGSYPR